MLGSKRSAGVTPEVNVRKRISHTPLPSVNKAGHSGFETQRRCHQKSETGVSVAPQKDVSTKIKKTRMHSSRMRTICCSGRLPWGVCVSALAGLPRRRLPRGVSARHPPWTETQTSVKTLLCRNYVADGNKTRMLPVGCVPSASVAWSRAPPEADTPLGQDTPLREQIPPPVNRITDTCENITLPQLRCGR